MNRLLMAAAVIAVSTSAAPAAEPSLAVRGQPGRVVARLVDQGLGYSVVHEPAGLSPRPYRVHVTCTIDESFAQTYCPTASYVSSRPRATIACR